VKKKDDVKALERELALLRDKRLRQLRVEEDYIKANRWEFHSPFSWQVKMRDAVAKKTITLAAAPNGIGKCLTYKTMINTPGGEVSIGSLYEAGRSFDVYAWDEERGEKVIAKAEAPFKKDGLHQCYKITMSDGRIIEAADYHRILTDIGWISVEKLVSCHFPASSYSLQESNLESSLSAREQGVSRLTQIQQGYQGDCLGNFHQYDVQLLFGADILPVCSPLPNDVLKHIEPLLQKGVLVGIYSDILSLYEYLLSSLDDLYHVLRQRFASLSRIAYKSVSRALSLFRVFQQPSNAEAFQPLPFDESEAPSQGLRLDNKQHSFSYKSPKKVKPIYSSTNRIVSIIPIGVKEVYDFEVGKYHNYLAGGLIHHNTTKAVLLVMSWLAGYEAWNVVDEFYPGAVKVKGKWYSPSSLGIKPPVRGRLTGNDWTHHLGQTVVNEIKKWFPLHEFRTKNNTQGVTWFWEHIPTGSTLELMTHDQKIDLYESWRGHFWLSDEPPPRDIFNAMSGRGLSDFGGKILIPATPLTQAWMLDELVLTNRSDVAVMEDLCCLDNEISYDHDDRILTEMGLTGKRSKHWREMEGQKKEYYHYIMRRDLYIDGAKGPPDDKGVSAEKFLLENTPESKHELAMKLQFLRKAKDTSLEEKASRFFGLFKRLVGLVVKEFRAATHIIPAFEIPPDYPVVVMIDLHLSKPHAISFFACDKHNHRHHPTGTHGVPRHRRNRSATVLARRIGRRLLHRRTNGYRIIYHR